MANQHLEELANDPTVRFIRYETEAMAHLRKLLLKDGHTDEQIDTFADCLIALERRGFTLTGPVEEET